MDDDTYAQEEFTSEYGIPPEPDARSARYAGAFFPQSQNSTIRGGVFTSNVTVTSGPCTTSNTLGESSLRTQSSHRQHCCPVHSALTHKAPRRATPLAHTQPSDIPYPYPTHTPNSSMTEYDYSEEDYRRFQATQRRIVHWADDTGACAAQYKSPFAPRSDVAGNAFYNPQPAHPHSSTRMPQHSYSHGYGATPPPQEEREPRRATTLVSPRGSVSQAGALAPSSRHRRAASHSPPPRRHSSRSGRHRSRSGTPMYVLQSPTLQYAQQQYLPQQPFVQQRVPYVVVLPGMPVHIVYPDPQHPQPTQRIFVSQSGHSRRTRSANHSRSSSRSRR